MTYRGSLSFLKDFFFFFNVDFLKVFIEFVTTMLLFCFSFLATDYVGS